MTEKTSVSKEEMQLLIQEGDALEAKIKEEVDKITKQNIENLTGLVFDAKDPEWNEFVVKRFQMVPSLRQFDMFIASLVFVYFIASGAFGIFDIGSAIPLLAEYINPKSFSVYSINIARYFFIYLLLMQYVIPNVRSYFSLRHKINSAMYYISM